MLIIGLTGGIGSGKSTVATLFEKRGIPIIDADIVSRKITAPGQATLKKISQVFGPHILNTKGELDRQALRKAIFSHADKRRALEAILHPAILSEMLKQTKELKAPYCLLAIPLLFETGQNKYVDRVLVVDAEENIRRHRIKKRDGLSEKEIDRVINAQINPQKRRAKADEIITNNGDISLLKSQINVIHHRYNQLAATLKTSDSAIAHF